MTEPKIITYHAYPPISIRDHDWVAYREGTEGEEGLPQGWGRTEAEAVADLLEREADSAD